MHAQSFFPVFVICFPSSLEPEKCLEKVTNSQPLELAQHFLNTVFLLSRTGKTSNSHCTGETFLTTDRDNYSNKIILLTSLFVLIQAKFNVASISGWLMFEFWIDVIFQSVITTIAPLKTYIVFCQYYCTTVNVFRFL